MAISVVVFIISFILEIVFNNFLPFMIDDLSLFTPMFVLVSLFIVYPFFRKNEIKYFVVSFVIGFFYDLIFTNLIFYDAILFLAVSFIVYLLYKYMEVNYLNLFICIVLLIMVYEIMNVFVILLFNLVPVTFMKVVYKISHSLLINIIYGEMIFFIIRKLPKKYRESSIN